MNPGTDGGPAFPTQTFCELRDGVCSITDAPGLTVRDYFAAAALQGLIAVGEGGTWEGFAAKSYNAAEAMLAERSQASPKVADNEELTQLRALLEEWESNAEIPEPDCSCHLSPPCGDCVEHGAARELLERTRAALAAGKEGA